MLSGKINFMEILVTMENKLTKMKITNKLTKILHKSKIFLIKRSVMPKSRKFLK